jgi:hypothetical protein
MTWTPISRERFENILRDEIEKLPAEVLGIYKQYAVAPFEQPCFRDGEYPNERVFVAARAGDRLLFFDDVEEDFGVGIADSDGVLRDLGGYGPLLRAVVVLHEGATGLPTGR